MSEDTEPGHGAPGPKPTGRQLFAAIGVFLAVMGFLGTLPAWKSFADNLVHGQLASWLLLVVGLAALFVAVLLILRLWAMLNRMGQDKVWRVLALILVGVIPLVVVSDVIFAGVDIFTAGKEAGAAPRGTSTSTSTSTSTIAFLDPQNGAQVKECPKIDGTGRIPPNMGLWIVVVPDIAATPKAYWIESQAKATGPDSWSEASPVSIGPPDESGLNAYIYAVLLDKDWSTYFAKSTAGAQLWATVLPPHSSPASGPVTVTRVAEPSGASCNS